VPIANAFAYLIHPGKGATGAQPISGKEVLMGAGKLFDMLNGIFDGDTSSRDFEVTFNPAPDGTQINDCRDLMAAFQTSPTLKNGLKIAKRLQASTDGRSGIGLLFLLSGHTGLSKGL
jgi:hypothetical protein